MITLIAYMLVVLANLMGANTQQATVVTIPPVPSYAPSNMDHALSYDQGCMCEDCYWFECLREGADEFTNLFNSYETKRASNGRLMIRRGNSGSFKFAKKG